MKRVSILGATGVLGRAVTDVFLKNIDKYMVTMTDCPESIFLDGKSTAKQGGAVVLSKEFAEMFPLEKFENVIVYSALDLDLGKLWKADNVPDYVINCVEAPRELIRGDDPHKYQSIYINAVFPHYLSGYAKETGSKLIHLTTDNVFSGERGNYTEEDSYEASDLYAGSKSLGEPTDCMVLRADTVGTNRFNKTNVENAYVNHHWNGITASQYGKICEKIIAEDLYEENLFHVFSPSKLSRYDLASLLKDKLQLLDMNIERMEAEESMDRTLSTVKLLNEKLNIPDISSQLDSLLLND